MAPLLAQWARVASASLTRILETPSREMSARATAAEPKLRPAASASLGHPMAPTTERAVAASASGAAGLAFRQGLALLASKLTAVATPSRQTRAATPASKLTVAFPASELTAVAPASSRTKEGRPSK